MKVLFKTRIWIVPFLVVIAFLARTKFIPNQFEALADGYVQVKQALQNTAVAQPLVKTITVYTTDGRQKKNFRFPHRSCARVCFEDEIRRAKNFEEACKKAGFEAYQGICCNSVCTGKIVFSD